MKTTKITFRNNGKVEQHTVEHNLNESFGLSIDNALNSWLARTDDFTIESFCEYAESKSPTIKCKPWKR